MREFDVERNERAYMRAFRARELKEKVRENYLQAFDI